MNIKVNSVAYDEGQDGVTTIRVFFNGTTEDGNVSVNGFVPLTSEEYDGNERPSRLAVVVQRKLAEMMVVKEETA